MCNNCRVFIGYFCVNSNPDHPLLFFFLYSPRFIQLCELIVCSQMGLVPRPWVPWEWGLVYFYIDTFTPGWERSLTTPTPLESFTLSHSLLLYLIKSSMYMPCLYNYEHLSDVIHILWPTGGKVSCIITCVWTMDISHVWELCLQPVYLSNVLCFWKECCKRCCSPLVLYMWTLRRSW